MVELKKIVKNRKNIVLLLLISLLSFAFNIVSILETDNNVDGNFYDQYISHLKGKITEQKVDFLLQENDNIIRADDKVSHKSDEYLDGKLTEQEYDKIINENKVLLVKKQTFHKIWDKYNFVNEDRENRYFLKNDKGLFNPFFDVFSIILILLLINATLYKEEDSGMIDMIKTSSNGITRVAKSKFILMVAICIVYVVLNQLFKLLLFGFINGFDTLLYPIQSIFMMSTSGYELNILFGIIVETVLKTTGLIGLLAIYVIISNILKNKEMFVNIGFAYVLIQVMMANNSSFKMLPIPGNLSRASIYLMGDLECNRYFNRFMFVKIPNILLVLSIISSLVITCFAYYLLSKKYSNFMVLSKKTKGIKSKRNKMLVIIMIFTLFSSLLTACSSNQSEEFIRLNNNYMTQNQDYYFVLHNNEIYKINKKTEEKSTIDFDLFIQQNDYNITSLIYKDEHLYISIIYDYGDDISSVSQNDIFEINIKTGEINKKWTRNTFRNKYFLGAVYSENICNISTNSIYPSQDKLLIIGYGSITERKWDKENVIIKNMDEDVVYTNGDLAYVYGRDKRIYLLDLSSLEKNIVYDYPVDSFTLVNEKILVSSQEGIGYVQSKKKLAIISESRASSLVTDGNKIYYLKHNSNDLYTIDKNSDKDNFIMGNVDDFIASSNSDFIVSKVYDYSKNCWKLNINKCLALP